MMLQLFWKLPGRPEPRRAGFGLEALLVGCQVSPLPQGPQPVGISPYVQDSLGFVEVPLGWAVCLLGASMLPCQL